MQVRGIGEMIRLMFAGKSSPSGVSSFQALTMSLSGRVGTGNIAGVATAITFGGPGAVFWMWMVAFLGASTAYVESTLAQIYKERDDEGMYRGGPAYYIEKCMGQKWYAWIFAVDRDRHGPAAARRAGQQHRLRIAERLGVALR